MFAEKGVHCSSVKRLIRWIEHGAERHRGLPGVARRRHQTFNGLRKTSFPAFLKEIAFRFNTRDQDHWKIHLGSSRMNLLRPWAGTDPDRGMIAAGEQGRRNACADRFATRHPGEVWGRAGQIDQPDAKRVALCRRHGAGHGTGLCRIHSRAGVDHPGPGSGQAFVGQFERPNAACRTLCRGGTTGQPSGPGDARTRTSLNVTAPPGRNSPANPERLAASVAVAARRCWATASCVGRAWASGCGTAWRGRTHRDRPPGAFGVGCRVRLISRSSGRSRQARRHGRIRGRASSTPARGRARDGRAGSAGPGSVPCRIGGRRRAAFAGPFRRCFPTDRIHPPRRPAR